MIVPRPLLTRNGRGFAATPVLRAGRQAADSAPLHRAFGQVEPGPPGVPLVRRRKLAQQARRPPRRAGRELAAVSPARLNAIDPAIRAVPLGVRVGMRHPCIVPIGDITPPRPGRRVSVAGREPGVVGRQKRAAVRRTERRPARRDRVPVHGVAQQIGRNVAAAEFRRRTGRALGAWKSPSSVMRHSSA